MGASTFFETGTQDTAEAAFNSLSQRDRDLRGTGPYQGGIGQKSDFRFRKRDPMPRGEAMDFASDDVDSYGRDDPAMVVPFFEPESETVVIEKRVRAESAEAALQEALERSGHDADDLNVTRYSTELAKKGYTAKLDKSTETTKTTTYEVRLVSGQTMRGDFTVSEVAAENIPDELLQERHTDDGYIYKGPENEYESFRDARAAVMAHYAAVPSDDSKYEINEIKKRTETTTFEAKRPASEVSTWDVRIEAEIYDRPEDPEAEGFLFYGWARE